MTIEADVVRDYFKAFNDHDLDAVVANFTDDAVILGSDGTRQEGIEEIRRHYANTFAMFPDGHCDLLQACGSDGTAAAESVFTGKRPGHNHEHRMTGAELLTIRDAKISQLRDYHSASGT
jgi:uncharacterized protein (TIGR02246 family)